jgi:Cupin-like domain
MNNSPKNDTTNNFKTMNETTNPSLKKEGNEVLIERRIASGLPYAEYLHEYVKKNRPVVVEGAVKNWPALDMWTPHFFKTRYASMKVNISYDTKMTFADFIGAVEASNEVKPGPYMFRLFLVPHLPELLSDVTPQNMYSFPGRLASPLMPRLWHRPDGYLKLLIGGVGGKFPFMHFDGDNMHAAITEIYGEKEFILYPPEDTPYLYPSPTSGNQSQIRDLEHPDREKFPLFSKATRYRTVLRPGEMIFVPSRWWHSARVISTSISVCQNMLDASNWDGYVADVCRPSHGWQMLKQISKAIYLRSLGLVIASIESVSRSTLGKGSGIGRRIATLAPTDISQTDDPIKWPSKNLYIR